MSLTVKRLNGDTTFLLTFNPQIAPSTTDSRFPGSYTILIDPWLSGPSSVWTPRFQISHHTDPLAVKSLAKLDPPDLILISQDKPDHCHRETLCSLPRDSRIPILATAAAAKLIKSWTHFDPSLIASLRPYSTKKPSSIHRIPLPAYSSASAPGELTIAYMPQKHDLTRLHNAIGLTYTPPSTLTTTPSGHLVNLPLSPPASPSSPHSPTSDRRTRSFSSLRSRSLENAAAMTPAPSTPGSRPPSRETEKTLSVLYTPHGVAYAAIKPYITSFLTPLNALPLTALFHSINTEQNPWFMGGKVAAGYPGGLEILRKVGACYWVGCHDEVKENRGLATVLIRSGRFGVEEVQGIVEEMFLAGRGEGGNGNGNGGEKRDSGVSVGVKGEGGAGKRRGRVPIVVEVGVGEVMRIEG
ncbi:hypothetical protein M8818_000283 [Zalaria obscura]|uniref:Uncharacterized protein n=1 Tax=Zalaria obscura TaxID=2024903 RepID=A0ACC3SPJ1_9PEZI